MKAEPLGQCSWTGGWLSVSAPSQPHEPASSPRNISSRHPTTAPREFLRMAWPCRPRKQIPTRRERLPARTGNSWVSAPLFFLPFFFCPSSTLCTVCSVATPRLREPCHVASDEGHLGVYAHHARRDAVYPVSPGHHCHIRPNTPRPYPRSHTALPGQRLYTGVSRHPQVTQAPGLVLSVS